MQLAKKETWLFLSSNVRETFFKGGLETIMGTLYWKMSTVQVRCPLYVLFPKEEIKNLSC